MAIQKDFIERATIIATADKRILGLAAGGSWITGEIDEFSDVDLLLFTKERIAPDKGQMTAMAETLGPLLNAFTGEHVGEPRLLICLYDDPLLHVDIKFLVPEELGTRVENPVVFFDRQGELQKILDSTKAKFPYPDYQWIEDRFWTWIHYAALKIGRGEYMEALDFFSYLRSNVLGPLLLIKNGKLPRGSRKVEFDLVEEDLNLLKKTIASYDRGSMLESLRSAVRIYNHLGVHLFGEKVERRKMAEERVMDYLESMS
jgi:hypothetical protein